MEHIGTNKVKLKFCLVTDFLKNCDLYYLKIIHSKTGLFIQKVIIWL